MSTVLSEILANDLLDCPDLLPRVRQIRGWRGAAPFSSGMLPEVRDQLELILADCDARREHIAEAIQIVENEISQGKCGISPASHSLVAIP